MSTATARVHVRTFGHQHVQPASQRMTSRQQLINVNMPCAVIDQHALRCQIPGMRLVHITQLLAYSTYSYVYGTSPAPPVCMHGRPMPVMYWNCVTCCIL